MHHEFGRCFFVTVPKKNRRRHLLMFVSTSPYFPVLGIDCACIILNNMSEENFMEKSRHFVVILKKTKCQ